MIKDRGFIFSWNGGKLEKAAACQSCKDRISHTLLHIQNTHKWALNITIVLCNLYIDTNKLHKCKYMHTTPHTNAWTQSHTQPKYKDSYSKNTAEPCSWNPWQIGGIRARNEPRWISHCVTFWIIISMKTAHYKNAVSLPLSSPLSSSN